MYKRIALILLAVMLLIPETGLAGVSANLNQQMATRSGPGTKYTEELGTLPQSTKITVISQIETAGTVWYQVEFVYNSQLRRAYTGKKRVNASGDIPWESPIYTEDILLSNATAYYGPGENYAARRSSVAKNTTVRVFGVELEWALCEYKEGSKWARGYIHVSNLGKTAAATPTPAPLPTATPAPTASPTPVPTKRAAFNVIDPINCLCVDYYGNLYDYTGHNEDFALMAGVLPVMSYFDGVPCIQSHTYVYGGPGQHYWRRTIKGGDYAYTGTLDKNLRIYGKENGWILIRYPSDSNSGYRYAWAPSSCIPRSDLARTPDIEFARNLKAITTRFVDATDDPDVSYEYVGTSVSEHIMVTPLAFLNEERVWVYCEYTVRDHTGVHEARGFLPADSMYIVE